MGDVALPVHVSLVFAWHLVPLKGFSWLMQFEAGVVDHGATMVNMTAPSFWLPDAIVKGRPCVEEAASPWPDSVWLERAPFPEGEPINSIHGRVALTLRASPSAVADPATEAAGCAATFRTTTLTRGCTVTETVCVRLVDPDCAKTGRDTKSMAIASVITKLRNATVNGLSWVGNHPTFGGHMKAIPRRTQAYECNVTIQSYALGRRNRWAARPRGGLQLQVQPD